MRSYLACSALLVSTVVAAFACSSTPSRATSNDKTDDKGIDSSTDDVGDASETPKGGWSSIAYPDGASDLKAIAAIAGGHLYTVGKKGVTDAVFHYDGSNWETLDVGAGDEVGSGFNAVWAASSNAVFVASSTPATTFSYDGTEWTKAALTPKSANVLFGISDTDVWLGASAPAGEDAVFRYNGKSWLPVSGISGTPNVTSLWASDLADLWAVNGGDLIRYNGISWKKVTTANSESSPTVRSVSGSSKEDVWIVGLGGECEHFDGTEWTNVDVGTGDLNSVWVGAADNAWAVGQETVLQWNGTEWIDATTAAGAPKGALRVTGSSDGDVWAWDANNEEFFHYVP